MGITDGVIASFNAKYTYNQWRPITAIREADTDGNSATSPDPNWWPVLMFTHPTPDYISTYCTLATAAIDIMESVFGQKSVTVTSESGPHEDRTYTSWEALENECVTARVYGGVRSEERRVGKECRL